jgi:hypothetical protein
MPRTDIARKIAEEIDKNCIRTMPTDNVTWLDLDEAEAIIQRHIDGEWIAVETKLPDKAGVFFVVVSGNGETWASISDYDPFGMWDPQAEGYAVTHWKEIGELPSPPRKVGEK